MLGLRIAMLRKKNNISLTELSKGIVSISHLSNLESNRYSAGQETLELFSERLNVPKEYLIEFEKSNENLRIEIEEFFEEVVLEVGKPNHYYDYKILLPINNLELEISYYLILVSYFYKTKDFETANQYCGNYLDFYLPKLIKNIDILSTQLRIYLLYFLGIKLFRENDFSQSNVYFSKLTSIINNKSLELSFLYNQALLNYKMSNNYMALSYGHRVLKEYLNKQQWVEVTELHIFLAVIYKEENLLEEASVQLEKALNICENMKIEHLKGSIFHNKGLIYEDLNCIDEALTNYITGLSLKDSNKFITLSSIIRCYIKLEKYDKAKQFINIAIQNVETSYDLNLLNQFKSEIHLMNGKIENFLEVSEPCAKFFEKNNFMKEAVYLYTKIGDTYFNMRKYKQASIYHKKAISLLKGGEKE